jgi:plasmid maintenance system antidote protein VapI
MSDYNLLDGLTCMVVNGDIASRSRLREVLKTCIYKSELNLFQSCREALGHLELADNLDVTFVSFNFGIESIKSFVRDISSQMGSKTPLIIVTIDKQNSKTATQVTNLYLEGVSGFIAEPYSPTELTALLIALKARQTKINEDAKQRKATRFLMQEATKRVDDMAKMLFNDKPVSGSIMKELKYISQSLAEIHAKAPELYGDALIDVFEKMPAPAWANVQRPIKERKKKKIVQHPGRVILDIMRERDLSLERLTPSIKMDLQEFQLFLECKREIDDDMSRELARLFGRTPIEWLKIQKDYEAYQATVQASAAAAERRA